MLRAAMSGRKKLPVSLALAFALVGCSVNEPRTSSSPEMVEKTKSPAAAASTDPVALTEQCFLAIEVAGAHSKLSTSASAAAITSCAQLFPRKRCQAAWLGILDSSATDKMLNVFSECAAAYCPSIADRELAACSGLADNNTQRYVDFSELTLAVHELEWGKDTARKMAERLMKLQTPVISISSTRVLLDGVEIVQVQDLPANASLIAPLFEALTARAGSNAVDLRIYLEATKQTSARHLNQLIKTSIAAGYRQISFCAGAPSVAPVIGEAGEPRAVKEKCGPFSTLGGSVEP